MTDISREDGRSRPDIVERLHVIRDHLRTGRFGQREVWEEWLTEAAEEAERLRAALQSLTTDPPPTLDEPDTDAEVVIKMREIARRALEPKP